MAACIHATWLLFWTIHKFQRFGDFTMKRWNFFFTKEQRTPRNSFGETWLCCASSWLTRGYKDVAPSCFLQCTCNTTGKICFSAPCETEPSKYKISSNMRCCPGERFVRREAGWERRPRGRTRDGRKARWRGKGGGGNQVIWNPGTRGHPFCTPAASKQMRRLYNRDLLLPFNNKTENMTQRTLKCTWINFNKDDGTPSFISIAFVPNCKGINLQITK